MGRKDLRERSSWGNSCQVTEAGDLNKHVGDGERLMKRSNGKIRLRKICLKRILRDLNSNLGSLQYRLQFSMTTGVSKLQRNRRIWEM